MEVGPTTHYMMGGIQVDARSQMTNVPGLFACGECASGLHGANRLGGNSLSDLLVFGKRAGEFSRLYAKKAKWGKIDPKDLKNVVNWASAFFSKGGRNKKENPFEVMADLRELMQNNVGIVRDEKELKIALAKLKVIQSRIKNIGVAGNVRYNPAWHTAMDLPNMLTIARAITMSAVERKESRGAHFREDYPQKDKKYATFNICLAKGGGDTIKLVRQAIPKIKRELQEIIEENNR
jgi:succinate dehydrogenase / fumarate reductase flavoprotein subunit